MKKLILITFLMVGMTVLAQEKHKKQHHRNEMEQFTPEQKSQLMVKKMTLELDLLGELLNKIPKIIRGDSYLPSVGSVLICFPYIKKYNKSYPESSA